MTGNFDATEQLIGELLQRAESKVDHASAYDLKVPLPTAKKKSEGEAGEIFGIHRESEAKLFTFFSNLRKLRFKFLEFGLMFAPLNRIVKGNNPGALPRTGNFRRSKDDYSL